MAGAIHKSPKKPTDAKSVGFIIIRRRQAPNAGITNFIFVVQIPTRPYAQLHRLTFTITSDIILLDKLEFDEQLRTAPSLPLMREVSKIFDF